MSRRKRMVSIPQWAALAAGLADDGHSLAVARALIAQGDGPQVVQVRRRRRAEVGVQLPPRDNDGLKRRLAPSSTARSPGQRTNPRRTMRGLGVLCPLDSFTIEHGSRENRETDVRSCEGR
jgi:hypothetical protein